MPSGHDTDASAPFAGLRVLDATRSLTGPLCTMILGDLGADVIKIEAPGVGDDTRYWGPPFVADAGPTFLAYNRNKRSVELDLRTPEGVKQFRRLVKDSDVVVENFRPGTMRRFGLAYDDIRQDRADIIYCSISGYGQTGPDSDRPAMDLLVQARSGLMALTGPIDGPAYKAAAPVSDVTAGLVATIRVMAALRDREIHGRGAYLDVSMLDAMCVQLGQPIAAHSMSGLPPQRWGNEHALMAPYQSFDTQDRAVVVAVTNDKTWRQLCQVPEFADLAGHPVYSTAQGRSEHRHELNAEVARRLKNHPAAHWLASLEAVGVPIELVTTVPELVDMDHLYERGALMRTEYPHGSGQWYVVPGSPWSSPQRRTMPSPPALGSDTDGVLDD